MIDLILNTDLEDERWQTALSDIMEISQTVKESALSYLQFPHKWMDAPLR